MSEEVRRPAMTEEEARQIIERVRARFAALGGPSLADELIADRRREAAREAAEQVEEGTSDQEGMKKQ